MGALYRMDSVEIQNLLNLDIICLCETWVHSDDFNVPSFLSDYNMYCVKADKTFRRGRASGGLLILIKKALKLQAKIISTCNVWLFLLLEFANDVLILGTVHLKPDIAFDVIIQDLNREFIDFRLNYGECGIIFGGDFNSRLGESNILDNDIFEGTCFKGCRQSADKEYFLLVGARASAM
uniref:Endonuclease/exonuclease/phosphatase domain-containing protein n=1 Tax=Rhodnius prolixus TaxID=13249 RepID=T1HGS3_RHOPR